MRVPVLAVLAVPVWAAGGGCFAVPMDSGDSSIRVALRAMYNSQFRMSRQLLLDYSAAHPRDPLAYSLRAASYLFTELDRRRILSRDFLKENRTFVDARTASLGAGERAGLNAAVSETRAKAQAALEVNPRDSNALLALCIVSGVQRDYLALVEHKLRESYEFIKESDTYSSHLLDIDPTAYDAYVSKGFTEYLVASLPFYLRWPMRLDNLSGTKQQGLSDLSIAARCGEYLRPFAQLLLALFYLRENRAAESEQLLKQLCLEYPENRAFAEELRKLEFRPRSPQ